MTLRQTDFHEVSVTTVTPFHKNRSIDFDALRRQVEFLCQNSIRILVPAGNTGEFTSLGLDEVKAVTRATVAAAGEAVTVIGGVGGSAPNAIELARAAQDDGAHAVMVHSPAHTFISPAAVADYILEIVEAVDIPVVPYKRGHELPDDVLVELSRHDQIVAIKYAANDPPAFAEITRQASAAMVCGTAERWAPFFALAGAVGFTSGGANLVPSLSLQLHEALRQGDYPTAMTLRQAFVPFEEARARHLAANNVSVVKYAMARVGLDSGVVRAPIAPLNGAEAATVDKILKGWARDGHLPLDSEHNLALKSLAPELTARPEVYARDPEEPFDESAHNADRDGEH